jgi:hypothetical protein
LAHFDDELPGRDVSTLDCDFGPFASVWETGAVDRFLCGLADACGEGLDPVVAASLEAAGGTDGVPVASVRWLAAPDAAAPADVSLPAGVAPELQPPTSAATATRAAEVSRRFIV